MDTRARSTKLYQARSAITGRFMRLVDAFKDRWRSIVERIRRP
jgi:hypothetical protein